MMKVKHSLIFLMAIGVILIASFSFAVPTVLDNLDNDSAITDETGVPDAYWFQVDPSLPNSNSIWDMSISTTNYDSAPASLKIDWNKPSADYAHFRFTRLDKAGNVGDFSGYDGIRIDVYGEAPNTLLKLLDTDGDESGDLALKDHSGSSWDTVEWPFGSLGSCDLNKITEILVFINAGIAGSGICYFDNVRLYKTGEELTIDNFDNDSSMEDDAANPDSKVTVHSQFEIIQVTADTTNAYSAPACAKAVYTNKPGWGLFFISKLKSGSGNFSDFSEVTKLSMAVHTDLSGQMLIKLRDASGGETGDLAFLTPQQGQWDILEWTIKENANLGGCNLSQVEEILVFPPIAGTSGAGTTYFDDVIVDAPVPPTPTPVVLNAESWEVYE